MITLINPNIITQKGDYFGSGIPYMPITLAYIAGMFKKHNIEYKIIDMFGEDPKHIFDDHEGNINQGLYISDVLGKISNRSTHIIIYAGQVVAHNKILDLINALKSVSPKKKVIIVENIHQVTAYSLKQIAHQFFDVGADFVVYGEPEYTIIQLLKTNINLKGINGIIYKKGENIIINPSGTIENEPDKLPFPEWSRFPLENYWKLRYAHAPYKGNFLPILTSRGCPFQCRFCIIPFINQRRWRARTAENVFAEMKYFIEKYHIKEFHFEDLNPIIDKERIKHLCILIINNNIKIKLKFASGTKLDMVDEGTIRLLKKAGCDYLSFSPESGSKRVLKLMKKPFNHTHALKMTKLMHKLRIITQCCYILGFPGEKPEDINKTKKDLYGLTKAGLDETVILVMTPIPGSDTCSDFHLDGLSVSKMTFSPKWRKNYKYLSRERIKMYTMFFLIKLVYHPIKSIRSLFNLLTKNFHNKIEMNVYRFFKLYWWKL